MSGVGQATFTALGTGAVVLVTDSRRLEAARRAVAAQVDQVDRACSRFRPDSELQAVNRAAGRATAVGAVLRSALSVALRAAEATEGDVDPTVGGAMQALGYDRDFASVARAGPALLEAPPRAPGWRLVSLDPTRGTVQVPAGVELDLGATAKAFCADRAAAAAAQAAGCGVLVSLGGDIAVAGEPPEGGWAVGIADSHARPDQLEETVQIQSGGLATSSTTVRRWERGGQNLHHVLDPSTGRPAEVVWRTVSVAAASCVDANIASTAALIRGERSPAWLALLGLPARLVRPDGMILRVAGWPL